MDAKLCILNSMSYESWGVPVWLIGLSTLLNTVWMPGLSSFGWLFPSFWFFSSHARADQYLAEYLRGISADLPSAVLCSSLLSCKLLILWFPWTQSFVSSTHEVHWALPQIPIPTSCPGNFSRSKLGQYQSCPCLFLAIQGHFPFLLVLQGLAKVLLFHIFCPFFDCFRWDLTYSYL